MINVASKLGPNCKAPVESIKRKYEQDPKFFEEILKFPNVQEAKTALEEKVKARFEQPKKNK